MKNVTVNYPVALQVDDQSQPERIYCVDVPGSMMQYGITARSFRKMKAHVFELIDKAINDSDSDNRRKRLLVCRDGHCLVILREHGNWGYYMASSDRDYAGSSWGRASMDEALADARRHAEQSYGGIAWESTL